MCGIWAFLRTVLEKTDVKTRAKLYNAFSQVRYRGPDRSGFLEVNDFTDLFFGFHRLAIMDKSTDGDQPFVFEFKDGGGQHVRTVYCLCNGEIYNFHQLIEKYELQVKSESDCEVIPLIYMKHGFEQLVKDLIGEFAILLVDIDHIKHKMLIKAIRDPCGVRPMFYSAGDDGVAFSSILKGLTGVCESSTIKQLPPGYYLDMTIEHVDDKSKMHHDLKQYYSVDFPINTSQQMLDIYSLQSVFKGVRDKFEECVHLMLESDRPLGALLSGGLDSSLVVSIASTHMAKFGKKLRTFSIGMPGATDEKYARMVADHCGTEHTHIEFTTDQFLEALEEVIWATETYDITTIRASTGQYLISKWINENTDVKVLLIGDGSDELCAGYMYFHKAPSAEESHRENCKLLREICYYDVLRADRCIAHCGIEARVPFLCYKFIDYYMSLHPDLRMAGKIVKGLSDDEGYQGQRMEKWLLRKSFDTTDENGKSYLPREVLFRKKEAFSDGVSSLKKSWYEIIQDMTEEKYTDKDLEVAQTTYKHSPPHSKEALYYRELFEEMFGKDVDHIIHHYWLPNWCGDITEPSARVLDTYK
jgi:asparagine synthase (glutamine-hydrolysing)